MTVVLGKWTLPGETARAVGFSLPGPHPSSQRRVRTCGGDSRSASYLVGDWARVTPGPNYTGRFEMAMTNGENKRAIGDKLLLFS